MNRKPISIPPAPGPQIPPDLARAERAAVLVILAHILCVLLLVGLTLLFFWAGARWLPWSLGFYFLGFVAVTMTPLFYLARKQS